MIIRIMLNHQTYYTNMESLDALKTSLDAKMEIFVWWYSIEGKRNREQIIIYEEPICLMTDQDASPVEEMEI